MYKCNFCKKTFKKENTLQTHMCEKKRRYFSKDDKTVMAGYTAYLYWNNKTSMAKKNKSFDVFIQSRLYNAFVKFGTYILESGVNDWELYLEWLIKNNIKIDQWSKDSTYTQYLVERLKKESPTRALERFLIFVQKWEEITDHKWYNFWERNSVFNTIDLIKDGKISPWILFCDPNAKTFINKLPDELIVELDSHINLSYWKNRTEKNKEDSEWITKMLTI